MADFIITHRIEAPELAAALNNLADALKNRPVAAPAADKDVTPVKATVDTPVTAAPVQAVSEAPVVNPTVAPVTPIANGPTPATTNAPIAAAPTPVPVEAPAPVNTAISDPAPAAPAIHTAVPTGRPEGVTVGATTVRLLYPRPSARTTSASSTAILSRSRPR